MVWLIKRVVLAVFPLCVALAALIPQVWAQDITHADSVWASLGFDDCPLPCYAGIRLGITPYEAVPDLIQQNVDGLVGLLIQELPSIQYWIDQGDRSISGTIFFQQGRVDQLVIVSDIEMSALFERYGAPDCVRVYADQFLLHIIWQESEFGILTPMSIRRPAESLRGAEQSSYISVQNSENLCQQSSMIDWRGFAPTWRYIQLYGLPPFSR